MSNNETNTCNIFDTFLDNFIIKRKLFLYDKFKDNCMLERNDYMLNNSSLVIALYNGKGGGTGYTVRIAKKKGLETIIIEP